MLQNENIRDALFLYIRYFLVFVKIIYKFSIDKLKKNDRLSNRKIHK